MKSFSAIIKILFLIIILLTGCSKKKDSSVTSNPGTDGYTNGGYVYPTATPTNGGGGTTTNNCSGDISDGDNLDNTHSGFSYPLHIHQIGLSGKVSWAPGLPGFRPEDKPFLKAADAAQCNDLGSGCAQGTSNKCYYCLKGAYGNASSNISTPFSYPNPLTKDSWDKFNNDGDIFIRLKLRSPTEDNINNLGGAYCYGRLANGSKTYVPYKNPYTKIKVDIYARVLKKISPCTTNCTENNFAYTATKYPVRMGYILETNKCSDIIRIPASNLINDSSEAVVVEIGNVFTNSPCLESSTGTSSYCPYSQLNTANCWFATLEIATNETQFFKGYKRANIP